MKQAMSKEMNVQLYKQKSKLHVEGKEHAFSTRTDAPKEPTLAGFEEKWAKLQLFNPNTFHEFFASYVNFKIEPRLEEKDAYFWKQKTMLHV